MNLFSNYYVGEVGVQWLFSQNTSVSDTYLSHNLPKALIEQIISITWIFLSSAQDLVFFAMEYLSGGDLVDFLNERAPLDIKTIR